jgi:hypothetical protein
MPTINLKPFKVDIHKTTWDGKTLKSLTKQELLTALTEVVSLLHEERENLAKTSRLLEFYLTNAKEGVVEAIEEDLTEYLRQYGYLEPLPMPGE